jgi:salicylate hydroxylase
MRENKIMKIQQLEVGIVGAGLGGLAAAIALQQQGIPTQVYEKAQELQPIGAGLTLFPNGLKVLDAIAPGIVETLKRLGSETHQVKLQSSTGDLFGQNQLTLTEKYSYPMLNLRWSDLQATLISRLPTEIIHLDHQCVDFASCDRGVQIQFSNGQTSNVDLLIGADGIHSLIRQRLVKDGSPCYAGRLSWRAVIPYQDELLSQHTATIVNGAEGKNFLLVDVGNGQFFWSAGALMAEGLQSDSPETVKSRVLETFANWAAPVEAIVEATPPTAIIERPIYDRPPLATWSDRNLTLLGDAAHPMVPSLGQGANMAFEDAWELAHCLAEQPTIAAALASYEHSRVYRTQIIQVRSSVQGSRSYDPDSKTVLLGVMEQAHVAQAAFEDWLYNISLER